MTDVLERVSRKGLMAAILAVITVVMGTDVAADYMIGQPPWHVRLEILVTALGLVGLGLLLHELRHTQARAARLRSGLAAAEAEAQRWRREAQQVLRGLGAAIDQQFARWGLTAAEREVALLLLKGLSHKEVAGLRETSERTVRQQALGIYRKSGLGGRTELAAFFLEDLLLPPAEPAAG
jgi:DNA-binding CsgD family transcriptional regulator